MRVKNKIGKLLIGTALVSSMLFGCEVEPDKAIVVTTPGSETNQEHQKPVVGIVAGELESDATISIGQDGIVRVVYALKNQTEQEMELVFPSGLKADYIVYDETGKQVKQFSEDKMFTMAIETMILKQGEDLVYTFEIEGLGKGKYTIKLFLNVADTPAEIVKEFTIE
ncbi:hypothetical protein BHU72_13525 [Desulfuribacillus stibiiarsenatis]|uniref:Intracellular proteinase inhibitor BsuPI domain-containing protein n=1 Tax=Desulfuribacillus stibiiarsenatis TaxID=1390249 RepID=A0A1E5L913_9FIRM|nr:BsuPI-related putative proteinase inhibitor [Desulfuribacillus stibiiarsenatis]OEH86433.1 hypothetical protein BHU72_13525 [Desulfuribacillus stibiiarsenatis]